MNKVSHASKQTLQLLCRNDSGVVFITVVLITLLLTFVGLSLSNLVLSQFARTAKNVYVSNALLVAEAGAEQSLFELNEDDSFSGFSSETTFFDDAQQGRGTYQTEITAGTSINEKKITSTGRVYRHGSSEIVTTRKVQITVVGTESPGYSVFTGPGGLILSGSATITNSELYVNGYITMSGSSQIGTSSMPVNVNVAHRRCPNNSNPGSSYPMVCNTGQPISMSGSSRIYGSVCATGQTTSTRIYPGNGGQGLIAGCVTDANISQPNYDRTAHINSMSPLAGYASNNSAYTCTGSQTKTWPANLRLNGNVSIGSSCTLYVTGNVYITGNLSIGGSSRIRVAEGLTTRPVIVVDGTITSGGSGALVANSLGTGFHMISFKSAASCAASCTNLSGNDLYNSANQTTINVGGSTSLAGMIFQAYWGKAVIGGSGNIGSVIGQTIDLSGSGTIVFGTSLSSGTSTWTVRSYQYDYD
jgi:Tfp pilus assembly protein PilX